MSVQALPKNLVCDVFKILRHIQATFTQFPLSMQIIEERMCLQKYVKNVSDRCLIIL